MQRFSRLAKFGALCFGVAALAAISADAAPTDDEILSLTQSDPALASPAMTVDSSQGIVQPRLVAIHKIAPRFTPTPGLVLRVDFKVRASGQKKDKGGLAEMTKPTIVRKVSRPAYRTGSRYRHTASADPYVYAYC